MIIVIITLLVVYAFYLFKFLSKRNFIPITATVKSILTNEREPKVKRFRVCVEYNGKTDTGEFSVKNISSFSTISVGMKIPISWKPLGRMIYMPVLLLDKLLRTTIVAGTTALILSIINDLLPSVPPVLSVGTSFDFEAFLLTYLVRIAILVIVFVIPCILISKAKAKASKSFMQKVDVLNTSQETDNPEAEQPIQ